MVFVTGVFFLFLFFSFMRTCALFFSKHKQDASIVLFEHLLINVFLENEEDGSFIDLAHFTGIEVTTGAGDGIDSLNVVRGVCGE